MRDDERKKALFLDRDGTLIVDRDYLSDPDGVELMPGVARALKKARDAGFLLVVVSNQSGVGRGYFPDSAVAAVNGRMSEYLAEEGVVLDGFYHCPHVPDEGCACRKPGPGMVEQAVRDLGIDTAASFVIGDKESDVQLAIRSGGRGILLSEDGGKGDEVGADFVAHSFQEAIEWVISHDKKCES